MSETPETPAETEETEESQETEESGEEQEATGSEEETEEEPEQETEADDEPANTPTAKLRAEAKKYRQRLRDTEAERDQLTEQLTAARGEIVQAAMTEHVGKTVLKVDDVFMFTKTTPADYLTEAGTTDQAKIESTITQLLKDRPELSKPQQGFDSARGKNRGKPARSFADAFKPRH